MAKEQTRMPSSTAGISQYYDSYTGSWVVKPGHVIIAGVVIGVLVLALHAFGGGLF